PRNRQGQAGMGEAVQTAPFSTEVTVKDDIPDGATLSDLKLPESKVKLIGLVRGEERRQTLLPDAKLKPGDTLLLEGEPQALDSVLTNAPLLAASDKRTVQREEPSEEVRAVEVVVQPG